LAQWLATQTAADISCRPWVKPNMLFYQEQLLDLFWSLRCSIWFRWTMTFLIGGLCSRMYDRISKCEEDTRPRPKRPVVKLEILRTAPSDEDCPICLESLNSEALKQSCARLPCQHTFHCSCIKKWFDRGAVSCPMCRVDASPTAPGVSH
jgi:hypothetical protein